MDLVIVNSYENGRNSKNKFQLLFLKIVTTKFKILQYLNQ